MAAAVRLFPSAPKTLAFCGKKSVNLQQSQLTCRRHLACLNPCQKVVKYGGSRWQSMRWFGSKTRPRRLTPVEEVQPTSQRNFRVLLKPLAFTVVVSSSSYGGAILWQYETIRKQVKKTSENLSHAQEQFYGKAGSYRHHLNTWWNSLSPGLKVVTEIIALNVGVFLLWKAKPLQTVMLKYFTSSPFAGASSASMILSTFSHYALLHLGINMFVLWSFSDPTVKLLGREQFLAFFLTAGAVSSLTSYIHKVVRYSKVPSLGASGAIMALLGMVCCQYPDSRLSIAFIDMLIPHSFSADTGMKALIIMDAAGIIFGWKLFDHAAHLGGMLFGIWYAKYGRDLVWRQWREPIMRRWHEYRGKI